VNRKCLMASTQQISVKSKVTNPLGPTGLSSVTSLLHACLIACCNVDTYLHLVQHSLNARMRLTMSTLVLMLLHPLFHRYLCSERDRVWSGCRVLVWRRVSHEPGCRRNLCRQPKVHNLCALVTFVNFFVSTIALVLSFYVSSLSSFVLC
jgi:hypothetical protein